MPKNYNPSDRNRYKIRKYCLNCHSYFYCDGSCEYEKVIDDEGFCYCPICWEKFFGKKKPVDECRKHCQVLMNYLIKVGWKDEE